jgi:hypothetical protein
MRLHTCIKENIAEAIFSSLQNQFIFSRDAIMFHFQLLYHILRKCMNHIWVGIDDTGHRCLRNGDGPVVHGRPNLALVCGISVSAMDGHHEL